MPLRNPLRDWPFWKQIRTGGDGTGREAESAGTRALKARIAHDDVRVAPSVCPYCAVGCGQLAYSRAGRLVAIEGDPASPISAGHLCPKGAASLELLTHPGRLTRVLYRAPRARSFEPMALETAMDMVAERVWKSRARTFRAADPDGRSIRHTTAIAHLGGATLDIEENYLLKKLFTCGLGMVAVSNQARI
jgi:formate dehydrogenase major subunit